MISLGLLAMLSLATWRISSLLVNETGPFDIFERFRVWLGVRFDEKNYLPYGTNVLSKAFTCIWCLSIYVGLALAAFVGREEDIVTIVVLWLGSSAGAILVQEIIEALGRRA